MYVAQFTAYDVYDFTVFFMFILLELVRTRSVEPVIQTTYLHNHNVLSCKIMTIMSCQKKKLFQETVFLFLSLYFNSIIKILNFSNANTPTDYKYTQ